MAASVGRPASVPRGAGRWLADALWIAAIVAGLVLAVLWFRSSAPDKSPAPESPRPKSARVPVVQTPVVLAVSPVAVAATPTPTPAKCPLFTIASPFTPSPMPPTRGWQSGASGFEAALRDQRLTHAPTLAYFHTEWCGYCRRFEEGLLDSIDVDRFLDDTVNRVRINPEDGGEDDALAKRLGVTGYPTLLLIFESGPPQRVSPYIPGPDAQLATPGVFTERIRGRIDAWVKDALAKAQTKLARGDYSGAADAIEGPLALRPDHARLYLERGKTRAGQGNLTAAIEDWRHASDLGLEDMAISEMGQALEPLERWAEVAACWTHLIASRPADPRARFARATALARAGDAAGALEDADQACQLGSDAGCRLVRRLDVAPARAAGSSR